MDRAPILLLAYNRPDSLERTLSSIAGYENSDQYIMYVHIDAPNIYKSADVECNFIVKRVIEKYRNRFKQFVVDEEKFHCGLANSVIKSVQNIISIYGKIIVVEDDLVVSKDCLNYLNSALEIYKDNKKIWSITGYCPPLDHLKDYKKSVFLTPRACSWVWATWIDRWERVDWDVSDYNDFVNDRDAQVRFCRGGYDQPLMLKQQMEGFIDSWGIRWSYAQSKQDMMTVYPVHNRVYHIGFTGGTHVNKEFPQTGLLEVYPECIFEENIDDILIKEYQQFCGGNPEEWDKCFEHIGDNSRFESMFNVMHLWKALKEIGHSISEYFFNRNFKRIAIYGKGKIGGHIENELMNSGVDVLYYIDRNLDLCDEIRCFSPDDVLPECDCIIISVTTNINSIRNILQSKHKGAIKSIMDVLKDR